MSNCKVHNIRFYKPKPKAIYCMSYNSDLKLLALSRSDASIELWNLEHIPVVEKRIPATLDNYSIEGLTWAGDRLFSVGLHALLIEYDLRQLGIRTKASVTGQTAFCLDSDKENKHLAIGTEQGYLNIFSLTGDEIIFDKFLDKQEGRILCLKYDATGAFIVSGSLDAIRVWDVRTGHAIHKMTTGRAVANKPTIVWCLAVTEDFTIVSGDSRGKLTFWDGRVGAQIESYQSHRADVLSLCLADDEQSLYCSGIDSNIVSYDRIAVKGDCYKWVKSIQRKVHDHDVRALALSGNRLYSGGVDGYLACSYHPPKTLVRYAPIAPADCVQVAGKSRRVLLKYPKCLEVWQMGTSVDGDDKEKRGGLLEVRDAPKKLLLLQRQIRTDRGVKRECIVTSALSPNGKLIAFSTTSILRLFSFHYADGTDEPQLTQCELPDDLSAPCNNVVFTPNSEQLIAALKDGTLRVIKIQRNEPTLLQVIQAEQYIEDTITILACSPCGQFFAAADARGNIGTWTHDGGVDKSWRFYYKLPKYKCTPTAISIQPKTMNLVIAYSDHKISEFSLHERKLTDFSNALDVKNTKVFSRNFPIRDITFDPRNDKVLLFHDDASIIIVNKDKTSATSPVKKRRTDAGKNNRTETHTTHSIDAIKTEKKHLVYMGWLSNDEMVAVEVSPLALLEQLPPGFKQNAFGTK